MHLNKGQSKLRYVLPVAEQFQVLLTQTAYEPDTLGALAESCFRVACQPKEKRLMNFNTMRLQLQAKTKGNPDQYDISILNGWMGFVDHLVDVLDRLGLRQTDNYCILEFEGLKNYNIECFQRIESNAAPRIALPDLSTEVKFSTTY